MKLIEAMKKSKELYAKAEDLRAKIGQHSADLDYETPAYPDQAGQVREWLQSHSDVLKEIARLQFAIQKTNIATSVSVSLGDKIVTKSIAEWLFRRGPKDKKGLASLELAAWQRLTDRNLKEGQVQLAPQLQPMQVKLRRYFDPQQRDEKVEVYRSEPNMIDAALEVANATTDLVE